jgi:GTP-dependent phosphoenolpyruvate carboxykinase
MKIMTRLSKDVVQKIGRRKFFKRCSVGTLTRKDVLSCTFRRKISSGPLVRGTEAPAGKKCLPKIASGWGEEGWLAEHMMNHGVEPGGKSVISSALPSACGKTNLAMLGGFPATGSGPGDDIAGSRRRGNAFML